MRQGSRAGGDECGLPADIVRVILQNISNMYSTKAWTAEGKEEEDLAYQFLDIIEKAILAI